MYNLLGLKELEVYKVNNHLSSGSTGIKYYGMLFDAMSNGLYEGFQGKNLAETLGTANQVMVKNKTYQIEGANQFLKVTTSNSSGVGAPDFDTGAGLPDAASTNHSVFRVLCKDETSSVVGPVAVIDQADNLWIPASNNFKFGFEVTAWNNRTQLRTMVMSQVGVCGVLGANKLVLDSTKMDDGTNPISSGNFLYVELAANRVRLVHGNSTTAPTLGQQADVPSGAFTCIVEYVSATNTAHLFVDGILKTSQVLSAWSTVAAMQFFLRAGNSKGYVQATHSPCDISIDSILISCPRT